jgi:rhodanese-related sulfurtransferase
MRRVLLESIGIVLFSISLAFLTNYFRSDGLPLFRPHSSPRSILEKNNQGEGTISLTILLEKLKQPGVIIIDARSQEEYQAGHLPGAINVPYSELFEESGLILQKIPFDMEIITYCEGIECSIAEDLASFLKESGFENVKVFAGGWEEWTEKGMLVEIGNG